MHNINYISFSIFILIIRINYILGQDYLNCDTKTKCNDCIQQNGCVWCTTPVDNANNIHCIKNTSDLVQNCPNGQLTTVEIEETIILNKPLNDRLKNPVQLSPQKVRISLGKNQKKTIHFKYAQARNYPIDLYYIMDLSASMLSHKNKLGSLGVELARTMQNITSDFRLGFGSFVDKVELPFVNIEPSRLQEPCNLKGKPCVPPYSFINHMQLTTEFNQFAREVNNAQVSGNLDAPEGGFDALMQAIVCKNEIGWRDAARHLIVFSTDASFHIAGDGKLAGIVEPNDAKCHMENNSYTAYLQYDYPSVSQISHIISENNINIIFAIVNNKNIIPSYQQLAEQIKTASFGILDRDSKNVINLVKDNYNKIVTSITMRVNATEDVNVQIASTCNNPIPNGCTKIHVAEEVNFIATIEPLKCNPNPADNIHTIKIQPNGVNAILEVEVEVKCNCDCALSSSSYYTQSAKECSNFGNLECGVCNCYNGHFGEKCQCDSATSTTTNTTFCRKSPLEEICSGVGKCKCGLCECHRRSNPQEKIYGKFCECNNYSCPKANGLLCSGNGECDCGTCICNSGWKGEICDCSTNQQECLAPDGEGQVCSGNGNCVCGKCECHFDDDNTNRYTGKYCEECPTCPAKKCDELRDCVLCAVLGTDSCNNCTDTINLVDNFPTDLELNEKQCRFTDDKECVILYRYNYNENQELVVRAQKNIICPVPPNILAWVIAVISSIVVIGLLTLIVWKILTELHDRREYAKFEEERKRLQWARGENPLYKQATTTFQNLAYTGSVTPEKS